MFDDKFFEEAFEREIEIEIEYKNHPGFQTLMGFVLGELEDELASKISIHVATCTKCFQEVASIREGMKALNENLAKAFPDPLELFPLAQDKGRAWIWKACVKVREGLVSMIQPLANKRMFYRHAAVFAAASSFLLLVNVFVNYVLSTQPALLGGRPSTGWWFHWLVIPWGILLILHGISAFRGKKSDKEDNGWIR
jgi:hypothetical protein